MHHWLKSLLALAAPLLLTACLWGPGKFASDLTLKKDGSFVLNYRGEVVLQLPPDTVDAGEPWSNDKARCHRSGEVEVAPFKPVLAPDDGSPANSDPERPCSSAELAKAKSQYEATLAEDQARKRKSNEEMAKAFGLPSFDDASNREFAAKLMKYSGWRSVTYRGNGVFDVDYHVEGRATQDFLFPMMPDNVFIIPFVAIRRRADGAVLVTAPMLTGGTGALGANAAAGAASAAKGAPVSRAQGRFSVITDGEILTNNSEDGASAHPHGRQVHWDVSPASTKIPETLIRL